MPDLGGVGGPRSDGDLDLYVCHYLKWDTVNPTLCQDPPRPGNTYCDPRHFAAVPDHVFRNDGGRFVDVTDQAGIVDRDGRGLGVVAADLDGDGKTDLFVANDTTANYFFRNQGGFRFTEMGLESGLATNASGGYLAGMGIACGDFDSDGRLDLAVTNFYGESTTFYHNLGDGLFSDRTAAAGLAAPTHFMLGFGLAALDANNDGKLDLAQANGHTNDYMPTTPYAMPAQLFLGDGTGKLFDVSQKRRPTLADSRGWARTGSRRLRQRRPHRHPARHRKRPAGSLPQRRRRGRPRAWSTARAFPDARARGNSLESRRRGRRVAVIVPGRNQVAERFGGGSYLSASDRRLHFGLGPAQKVDRITVKWPSGRVDIHKELQSDKGYLLREGSPMPDLLPGFDGPAASAGAARK